MTSHNDMEFAKPTILERQALHMLHDPRSPLSIVNRQNYMDVDIAPIHIDQPGFFMNQGRLALRDDHPSMAFVLFSLAMRRNYPNLSEKLLETWSSDLSWYSREKLLLHEIRPAAHKGDPPCCYFLGMYHLSLQERETAKDWFKRAAEQNHADAAYELSQIEHQDEHYTLAIHWAERAVDAGNIDGCRILGQCYEYGHGVVCDTAIRNTLALHHYRRAASQNRSWAHRKLSQLYKSSKNGVRANATRSQLHHKLADHFQNLEQAYGKKRALECLLDDTKHNPLPQLHGSDRCDAHNYDDLDDDIRLRSVSYSEIQRWKRVAATFDASDDDHTVVPLEMEPVRHPSPLLKSVQSDATSHGGQSHGTADQLVGHSSVQSTSFLRAVQQAAMESNKSTSTERCNINSRLKSESESEVAPRSVSGPVSTRRSSRGSTRGSIVSSTTASDESYLLEGDGQAMHAKKGASPSREDLEQALAHVRQHGTDATAHDQYLYAEMLFHGIGGVSQNHTESIHWYRRAADRGHARAQNNLGKCFHDGAGVKQNYKQAVEWFKKAILTDNNLAEANYNLGLCYQFGHGGLKQSATAALNAFTAAVAQGCFPEAEFYIAEYHHYGCNEDDAAHASTNLEEAIKWYTRAAHNGHSIAKITLERMRSADSDREWTDFAPTAHTAQSAMHRATKAEARSLIATGTAIATSSGNSNGESEGESESESESEGEGDGESEGEGEGHAKHIDEGTENAREVKMDRERFQQFKLAATQGRADAQYNMGVCYSEGLMVRKNLKIAAYWFSRAANQGNANAQYNMGVCYAKGNGVAQDSKQAATWYMRAAEQRVPEAEYLLGLCYINGNQGLSQDSEQAAHYFERSATQGYVQAQYEIGLCYDQGQGVTLDHVEAARWFRLAANQNHADAQNDLGICYDTGQGVKLSPKRAARWFRRAAKQGYAEAQYNYGLCMAEGQGVAQNAERAARWFMAAARQGHAQAQYELGMCYLGEKGVPLRGDLAVKWLQRAADQGIDEARAYLEAAEERNTDQMVQMRADAEQGNADAQTQVAMRYSEGIGVPEDQTEATRWFRKAAENNHAEAQFQLARRYWEGESVEQSNSEFEYWCKRSAQQGFVEAEYSLGLYYTQNQHLEKAFWWIKRAAEQSHVDAQFNVGAFYYNGDGVERDYVEAALWFQRAAEKGDAGAQHQLGICYYFGQGVVKNRRTAIEWFQKAAAQGHADAVQRIQQRDIGDDDHQEPTHSGTNTLTVDEIAKERSMAPGMSERWFAQRDAAMEKEVQAFLDRATGSGALDQHLKLGGASGAGESHLAKVSQLMELYRQAVLLDDAEAQYELGAQYMSGTTLSNNDEEAVAWLERAAQHGHPEAQYQLGACFASGQGVPAQDDNVAAEWFTRAANQQHREAQYALSQCYIHGRGVDANEQNAMFWLHEAANQGHVQAQLDIRSLPDNGMWVTAQQHIDKELQDLLNRTIRTQAPAASPTLENNDDHDGVPPKSRRQNTRAINAAFQLGRYYDLNPYGDPEANPVYWYERAAKQGDVRAKRCLVRWWIDHGNPQRAYNCVQQMLQHDPEDSWALYQSALFHDQENGVVERDPSLCAQQLKRLAGVQSCVQGDAALYLCGMFERMFRGHPNGNKHALMESMVECAQIAIDAGKIQGYRFMAMAYENGYTNYNSKALIQCYASTESDTSAPPQKGNQAAQASMRFALHCYQRAAHFRQEWAVLRVGDYYALGIGGTKRNYALASKQYEQAIWNGSKVGMLRKAQLFLLRHERFEKDDNEAMTWTEQNLTKRQLIQNAKHMIERAAMARVPDAMYMYAQWLWSGTMLKRDMILARETMEAASNQTNLKVLSWLIRYYTSRGEIARKSKHDSRDIAKIYQLLCELQRKYSAALNQLSTERKFIEGKRYLTGTTVYKDEEYAAILLESAALEGHHDACAYASKCYRDGLGVEQDLERARRFWYASGRKSLDQYLMTEPALAALRAETERRVEEMRQTEQTRLDRAHDHIKAMWKENYGDDWSSQSSLGDQ